MEKLIIIKTEPETLHELQLNDILIKDGKDYINQRTGNRLYFFNLTAACSHLGLMEIINLINLFR